jgi:hypothetical protein
MPSMLVSQMMRYHNHCPLIYKFQRSVHNIEHQITYEGSNFIFHDSRGFESGATEELDIAWDFIERKSAATELRDQLHAIWYLSIYSVHD